MKKVTNKRPIVFLAVCLALLVAGAIGWRAASIRRGAGYRSQYPGARAPGALANFELTDTAGHAHELYRYADRKAIVILSRGIDCPVDRQLVAAIPALRERFSGREVAFLGLDVSAVETRESDPGWPILRDPAQLVARQLGFTRTSEAVVIDPGKLAIAYRGPFDGLAGAIEAVLKGKVPEVPASQDHGCAIKYREDPEPLSYSRHIAPILKEKCLNCHSAAGEMKPHFNDYESVRGWTSMIRETVMTGKMPIWGIDSDPGEYLNDNSLTSEQKRRLISWIDQGAPRGEGPDPLKDHVPSINSTPLPGAALVVGMEKEMDIPPEGYQEYNYFQLGGPLERDMWVNSVEGFTTNPRAMHHATLNVMPHPLAYYERNAKKLQSSSASQSQGPERTTDIWMGIAMNADLLEHADRRKAVPGSPYRPDEKVRFIVYSTYGRNNDRAVPSGTAWFLPKGHYLILETHHHGTGKPEKERTTLYFYEAPRKPKPRALHRIDVAAFKTEVPPLARNFRVDLPTFVADRDLYLLTCNAHMHIRGRELQATALLPDGRKEKVITVSSFLYDWHTGFSPLYAKPRYFPRGTRFRSHVLIDNSVTNPYNPDPSRTVYFGQTLDKDEMPKFQCVYHYADE